MSQNLSNSISDRKKNAADNNVNRVTKRAKLVDKRKEVQILGLDRYDIGVDRVAGLMKAELKWIQNEESINETEINRNYPTTINEIYINPELSKNPRLRQIVVLLYLTTTLPVYWLRKIRTFLISNSYEQQNFMSPYINLLENQQTLNVQLHYLDLIKIEQRVQSQQLQISILDLEQRKHESIKWIKEEAIRREAVRIGVEGWLVWVRKVLMGYLVWFKKHQVKENPYLKDEDRNIEKIIINLTSIPNPTHTLNQSNNLRKQELVRDLIKYQPNQVINQLFNSLTTNSTTLPISSISDNNKPSSSINLDSEPRAKLDEIFTMMQHRNLKLQHQLKDRIIRLKEAKQRYLEVESKEIRDITKRSKLISLIVKLKSHQLYPLPLTTPNPPESPTQINELTHIYQDNLTRLSELIQTNRKSETHLRTKLNALPKKARDERVELGNKLNELDAVKMVGGIVESIVEIDQTENNSVKFNSKQNSDKESLPFEEEEIKALTADNVDFHPCLAKRHLPFLNRDHDLVALLQSKYHDQQLSQSLQSLTDMATPLAPTTQALVEQAKQNQLQLLQLSGKLKELDDKTCNFRNDYEIRLEELIKDYPQPL